MRFGNVKFQTTNSKAAVEKLHKAVQNRGGEGNEPVHHKETAKGKGRIADAGRMVEGLQVYIGEEGKKGSRGRGQQVDEIALEGESRGTILKRGTGTANLCLGARDDFLKTIGRKTKRMEGGAKNITRRR